MSFPRIVIAAPKSGSGKTLITISLIKALLQAGHKVSAFKCGPDYIDPMFHKNVLGVPSKNLDLFFTGETLTQKLFCESASSDISVIEGVMGLYDGAGGNTSQASSYHLAKTLKAPVILVIDAKGMGLSVIAELKGFLSMDEEKLIKGVIFNNMGQTLFESLKPQFDKLNVSILGFYPSQKNLHLESRYLGLKLPEEISEIKEITEQSANALCKTVKLDEIIDISKNFGSEQLFACNTDYNLTDPKSSASELCRIAIARDAAFCFYYEDNLKLLEKYGATLVEFSPLYDSQLPENIHGIILGGGYPELFAKQLENNISMKTSIKTAVENGIPCIAECGGFMYLHNSIKTQEGEVFKMCGVIDGTVEYKNKLVRFGYIKIKEKKIDFLPEGGEIRGHEFHYFDSTANGADCIAEKPVSGKNWESTIVSENCWFGFAHLYYYSNPVFAQKIVEKCVNFAKNMEKHYKFFQNTKCENFPCHKTENPENFNCLFCYCPLYFLGDKCGGNFKYTQKGIKSCINCSIPHMKENYDLINKKLKELLHS